MENPTMQTTAMLWTGGKDSSLALDEALQSGYNVSCLVTFAPPEPDFLAHPLTFIKKQAQALALPHYILPVSAPFESSYEAGLSKLRNEMDIGCVITGDIAEVNGYPNWIRQRSCPVGLTVHTPLWGRERRALLRQLLDRKFETRISCIDMRWLREDWIGQKLNEAMIAELCTMRAQTGLDICGEEGAYHTLVTDGPQFKQAIHIRSYSKRIAASLSYMEIHELELIDHAG